MAGLKPRAGSYLELDLPGRKNSLEINPTAVLSPITELAKNLESSLGRTPKRKLSLSGSDALTPCSTSTLTRSLSTVSNESGYCPGSPPGLCFDSPSLEVLKSNAEKRALRRHAFKRWNSLPVKTGEDHLSANKENIEFDLELEKENDNGTTTNNGSEKRDFKFVQPKCPVVRRLSKSSSRRFPSRTFSDPSPQPLDQGSSAPSSPCYSDSQDSGLCVFDHDAGGDDDGFIDDLVQEQGSQDHSSQVPDGMAQLLSAPLVSREDPVEDGRETSTGETPKASGPSYTPRDLFNAGRDRAYTVASGSPTRERLITRPQSKSFAIKRPNPRRDPSPNLKKRLRQRCMSLVEANSNPALLDMAVLQSRDVKPCPIRRSHSATFEHELGNLIDTAGHATVVGDFSRPYTLPSIPGQHEDLKCLTPETVARVLDNKFPDVEAHIIDCRYPYEYNAGHIRGADNIYTKEEMFSRFIENPKKSSMGKTTILIFHCEFSSKRGPDMSRFLRNRDRDVHYNSYPTLYYPELYLIEGGYKAFFAKCKEYCEPQCYLPMLDENYAQDLKRFSRRSKSDGNILAKGFRPGLGYHC